MGKRVLQPIVILTGLMLLFTLPVFAGVEAGGDVKTTAGTIIKEGDNDTFLRTELDLELYLPDLGETEPRFQVRVYHDTLTDETDYFFKKLYLKHKFENFHLSVGRQPISWSFGSLLNPVDYNQGAVVLEEETGGKFVDAVEGYIPIDWSSGVTMVASFPDNSDHIKWGVRGRTEIEGYDLSLNLVREPERKIMGRSISALNRAGVSVKGDLGPAGIYGAFGYYGNDEISGKTYLLGTDYSKGLNYGNNKITGQLEYINIETRDLTNILGAMIPVTYTGTEERLDLLLGNVSYEIDQFSSVSLMAISSPDDGSYMVLPSYKNQIGNNLDFRLRAGVYLGDKDSMFGSEVIPEGTIEAEISYPF